LHLTIFVISGFKKISGSMKHNSTVRKRIFFLLISILQIQILHAQSYQVSTYAGSTGGFADGDTATAKFKKPFGMCIDHAGNLYIADPENHRIRKIDAAGQVTTVGGDGTAGYQDGAAATSKFNEPSDLCADVAGNIYVSDFVNQRIRMISFDGMVTTIAGSGIAGFADGPVATAEFNYPRGIVMDSEGNLFIGDSWNHRIRKIDMATLEVSTFAGGGSDIGVGSVGDLLDAADTSARFYTPSGLGIDSENNLYVADAYNHRIRKIAPDGVVTTIAGSGSTGPDMGGYADGVATYGMLNTPTEVFSSPDGALYIGDTYNNRIRKVEDEMLITIAGNGNQGYVDGPATEAEFNYTRGVVTDAEGQRIYVCDYNNHRIRVISPGVVAITESNVNEPTVAIEKNLLHKNELLHVALGNIHADGLLVLADIMGKTLSEIQISCDGHHTIPLSGLMTGNYFLMFIYNNQVFAYQVQVY